MDNVSASWCNIVNDRVIGLSRMRAMSDEVHAADEVYVCQLSSESGRSYF